MAVTASDRPSRKFYGWNNAALLFLIQFASSGFVYFAYSAIFPVMVGDMGWNRGEASIAHSISFVMLGLFYPLTAWIIEKRGVRFTLTIGLLLMLAGLLAAVFLVTQIWHWTIVWGIVVGLAFALTGPICAQTLAIQWFNIRRATVLGIVVTGNAAGGFVAQPILTTIMESFDSWQAGWATSAAMVAAAIILVRFLINNPSDIGQFPDNIDPREAKERVHAHKNPRTYRSAHNWKLTEVFRSHTVYLMAIISTAYLSCGTFLITHGALFLSDIGMSKLNTASLMGIFIMGSGMGRIPAGWLGDQIEMRWLIAAMMVIMLASFSAFGYFDDFAIIAVSGFVLGLCYGGLFAIAPAVISNFYGARSFTKINSIFAPALLPFVALVPTVAGYLFEANGSYALVFTGGSLLLGLAVIAAILLKPPIHKS